MGRERALDAVESPPSPRRNGDGLAAEREFAPGEEEMVMNLERDQLVFETLRPLPRAVLSKRAIVGLWALRVFSIVLAVMVIYTFIARLG